VSHGNAGSWESELSLSGLPEERSKELADALNALTGNETPKEYPHTGLLTSRP